jgi:hypothetical protein
MTKKAGSGAGSESGCGSIVRGMDPRIQIQIQIYPNTSLIYNTANIFRLYKVVVHPLIWEYWEQNREMVIATADEEDVKLTGDGQFDSPGFMAKFLFYRYGNLKLPAHLLALPL